MPTFFQVLPFLSCCHQCFPSSLHRDRSDTLPTLCHPWIITWAASLALHLIVYHSWLKVENDRKWMICIVFFGVLLFFNQIFLCVQSPLMQQIKWIKIYLYSICNNTRCLLWETQGITTAHMAKSATLWIEIIPFLWCSGGLYCFVILLHVSQSKQYCLSAAINDRLNPHLKLKSRCNCHDFRPSLVSIWHYQHKSLVNSCQDAIYTRWNRTFDLITTCGNGAFY